MKITLTLAERWILCNQLEILRALHPKETRLRRSQEALEHGWEWEYEHCLPNLSHETFSEEGCAEVRAVLDMYNQLQQALPEEPTAAFRGFPDAETSQALYSHWILKSGEEYEGLKRGTYPSVPQLGKYRRMLGVFKVSPKPLSPEQAKAVLAAGDSH